MFVFATNCINIALVQSFWNKNVVLPIFERYNFVTMVHKGANFRTSLCFQSSLEAKFEGWGNSKYIFKARVWFIEFLKKQFFLYQNNSGGHKNLGDIAP